VQVSPQEVGVNKIEALKAAMDGKKIQIPHEERFTGRPGVLTYGPIGALGVGFLLDGNGTAVSGLAERDDYEIFVEPPKEVSRAEAWAALGEGKVVKVAYSEDLYYRVRLRTDGRIQTRRVGQVDWMGSFDAWPSSTAAERAKFYVEEPGQ
jgi:hypothetical protein